MIQYGADGTRIINPRYYTIGEQSELSDLPIMLKPGIPSTIYVVANTNSRAWANASARAKFTTIGELEAMDTPNNMSQEGTDLSLPMCGKLDGVTVGQYSRISIPVTRMVAKLKIKVNIGKANWEYKNINVINIPNKCRIATLMDADRTVAANYGTATQWYTRSHAKISTDTDEYDYVIYVPECLHGVKEHVVQSTKTANVPLHALNVYVEIKYNSGEKDNEFTVYPGANVVNDYNIERNHVYDVKLQISRPRTRSRGGALS